MTLISVALPVYNGATYLPAALDTILAQTYSDFELVVSDNCSTDETPEILAQYAMRDTRVKVFRSHEFLSQADNVNRAISLCSSEWVKLFCHDDLMRPNCIGAIVAVIVSQEVDGVGLIGNGESWVFANGYEYTAKSHSDSEVALLEAPSYIHHYIARGASPGLPSLTTATVRKMVWERSSKFESKYAHFDVFLWMNILLQWDYLYTAEVLTCNRIHGGQVAVSARKSLKSIEDFRCFFPSFLARNQKVLKLSRTEAMLASLRPVSVAGTTISVNLLKRDFRAAISVLGALPQRWWPVILIFVFKNYYSEVARIRPLHNVVPVEMIYPD